MVQGDIDITSSTKMDTKLSINQINNKQFINESGKNSISYRINNMDYNKSSEHIKKRAEMLACGKSKRENVHDETKSETALINLVQNQEGESTTVGMSEGHEFSEKPDHTGAETQTESVQSSSNSVWTFIDKYKFWIIVGLVGIALIFMIIAYFYGGKESDIKSNKYAVVSPEHLMQAHEASVSNISPQSKTIHGGNGFKEFSIDIQPDELSPISELPQFFKNFEMAVKAKTETNVGTSAISDGSQLMTNTQGF